jgi:predicted PurR-regulated permease PerM
VLALRDGLSQKGKYTVWSGIMDKLKEGVTLGFINRVLFIIFAAAICALLVKLYSLWLLMFGAVIVAVVLRSIGEPIIKLTRMPESLGVLLALILVIGVLSLTFYLFGRELVVQTQNLSQQIPKAWENLQTQLHKTDIGDMIIEQVNAIPLQANKAMSFIPEIASNIASTLTTAFLVIIAGIFLAIKPGNYRDGVVRMFPLAQRELARESMDDSGKALRNWLTAQFVSMILVGSLVSIGLSIIGVPSGVVLGLISGLAQFVPLVGPIISAVPGLILAASAGSDTLVWALIIYVGVSQLESNFITPMVQRHVTSVPVVLTLFAVIGFATLFGPLGVFFATPLTVVMHTLVMKLYVGKVLGDKGQLEPVVGDKAKAKAQP